MKKLITLFSLVLMTLSVSAQSVRGDLNGDGQVTTTDVTELYNIIFGTAAVPEGNMEFSVNGITFKIVKVDGGTFQMGATSEQGSDALYDEKPAHSVTLSDYWIGETEVTQALWEAVMGSNPSNFKGSNRPVEYVSWNDCQEFVNKLNSLLSDQLPAGRQFRLPTEAEWEYAARGGNRNGHYKYSGSNDIGSVAWYDKNSLDLGVGHPDFGTHDVKTKNSNELGIYDMTGNVWEWCQDWFDSSYYGNSPQTNPTGPSSGYLRVLRGGSWSENAGGCRVSRRGSGHPSICADAVGLRVALSESAQSVRGDLNGDGEVNTSDVTELYNIIFGTAAAPEENIDFNVNGVTFKMVKVDGGTFQMGATSEQGSDANSDESPVHSVTLSDYWIGETEVTQALWEAVMGSNPSYFSGSNRPVEMVSWEGCQEFVNKLNSLLSGQLPAGHKFRLPTEAEWEFAARGGNKAASQTKYAGSDNIDDVAWWANNSDNMTHDVATKAPNALGIYDMSGNVLEWCQDLYGSSYYGNSPQSNPTGPSSGSYRVLRGGCWDVDAWYCRVSYRIFGLPSCSYVSIGLRVAL